MEVVVEVVEVEVEAARHTWPYHTGPYDEPFDEPYLNLSSKKPSTLSQYLREEGRRSGV